MSNKFKTKDSKQQKKANKNIKKSSDKKPLNKEDMDTIKSTLKSMNMKLSPSQEDLVVQIFKFIVVGGIATVIDWTIYFILYHFVKIDPLIGNILAFAVAVTYNYWASCKYVFNVTKDKSKLRLFIEFIIFAVIGLGINELLIFALYKKLGWNAMLVKILATIIVMIFNFVTRKKFLEKK
jgi:putative flippase GtrA